MKTPDRWVDQAAAGGDSEEARLGALLRAGRRPTPLSATELAVVWARLDRPTPRLARRWVWQLAIGLLVLLGGGALVAAKTQLFHWLPSLGGSGERPVPLPVHPSGGDHPRHAKPTTEAAPVLPAVPSTSAPPPLPPSAPAPAPASHKPERRLAWREPTAAGSAPVRAVETAPPPAPATIPPAPPTTTPPPFADHGPIQPGERPRIVPSILAEESKLLGSAIHQLRHAHDAAGALALLDERRARFPNGALGAEADLTRVEALLQLDRRADALAQLDPLRAPWTGRRRELLVARGELRADAGRCAEALVDFGVIVTDGGARDRILERALYGRAGCRARRGDGPGARADLERYLDEFPEGRFAGDARALLQKGTR